MPRPPIEHEIDRLYQLPLAEFTPARNVLAKEAGASEGKRIRTLAKPSTSAWAVNQFYWRDRKAYDALVTAAERLRAAHRAVLAGNEADLRGADAAHREAQKGALSSTLRLLKEAGQPVSSATHTEIARTLESLPVEGASGRLVKPLRPEGFAALQGLPIQQRKAPLPPKGKPRPDKEAQERQRAIEQERERKQAERELAAARERKRRERAEVAKLQKELAAAERTTATSKRDWERARDNELKLRNALRQAEEALERTRRLVNS
jgi:DNA repair exonuclease SbcCD ATPase subunit